MSKKIAIIISDFNQDITSRMLEHAKKTAKKLSLEIALTVHVPGAFEIPFAMKKVVEKHEIDGVVCLGAVVQGDTDHDIIVSHNCATEVMRLSLEHGIPVGFGVMGPRLKADMAKRKAEEYSGRAVEAVAQMVDKKY